MSRNPHIDLYNLAREANDLAAVQFATIARDLFSSGSRQAAERNATMARQCLRAHADPIRAHDGRTLVEVLASRAPL